MTKLTMLMATVATGALLAGCGMFDGNRSTASRQTTSSTAAQAAPSAEVRQVQVALNSAGYYSGEADGIWGPRTSDALRSFQQARGLEATGRIDNPSLNALGVRSDSGATQTGAATTGTTGTTGSTWGSPVTSPSTGATSPSTTSGPATGTTAGTTAPTPATPYTPPGTAGSTATSSPPAAQPPAGASGTMPRYPSSAGATPSGRQGSAVSAYRGAKSDDVRRAQESLERAGYEVGAVDGIWGPRTSRATREFQQARGLPASGELDRQTLSALGM